MMRADVQRRIMARTGTEPFDACLVRQPNAQMRALELTTVEIARPLSAGEQREGRGIAGALAGDIEAIWAASNAIEDDFRNNQH